MIENFISQFTDAKIDDIIRVGKSYYLVEPDSRSLMQDIDKKIKKEPFSVGLFLGEEKGKEFKPGLALLDLLSVHTKKTVTIDNKAEWLFICGRDVFSGSIVESNVKEGLALVLNKKKEVLGYGRVTGNLASKKVAIKNLMDRGDFLRREMTKESY